MPLRRILSNRSRIVFFLILLLVCKWSRDNVVVVDPLKLRRRWKPLGIGKGNGIRKPYVPRNARVPDFVTTSDPVAFQASFRFSPDEFDKLAERLDYFIASPRDPQGEFTMQQNLLRHRKRAKLSAKHRLALYLSNMISPMTGPRYHRLKEEWQWTQASSDFYHVNKCLIYVLDQPDSPEAIRWYDNPVSKIGCFPLFPKAIAIIDGTTQKGPKIEGGVNMKYGGGFLHLCCVDERGKFIFHDGGTVRRNSDDSSFTLTDLHLKQSTYLPGGLKLLADGGYKLRDGPFQKPFDKTELNQLSLVDREIAEKWNKDHTHTRVLIEWCFGRVKVCVMLLRFFSFFLILIFPHFDFSYVFIYFSSF